jgi:probable HAF family extracellular repeat protein
MRNLGTLGGNFSRGTAVNNLGQAVGWSTNNGLEQAFIYDLDGVMKPLGTLEQSRATAINDLGIVVGVEFGVAGFYWDNVNGITHLPPNIVPVDINNFGVIVGGGQIWSRQTGTQSLTDLLPVGHGWSEITINAINDSGQIVGYGRINDEFYGFVATPIPEPSHIILTIAFGVFVIFRRSPVAASIGKKLRRVRGSPSTLKGIRGPALNCAVRWSPQTGPKSLSIRSIPRTFLVMFKPARSRSNIWETRFMPRTPISAN